MAQTVLVTGGAGYIGSHACKALRDAGFVPVTYDNLCTGWQQAVKFGPFEQGDLMDRARLDEVFARHKPVAVTFGTVSVAPMNTASIWVAASTSPSAEPSSRRKLISASAMGSEPSAPAARRASMMGVR